MVSMRNKFGVYFFVSALVLLCLLIPAELKASIPCCKNGQLTTCPNLPNGQQYDISGCTNFVPIDPIVPIDPDLPIIGPIRPVEECTSGQVQYQPKGDCGTSERLCCSDGTWSEWDGECGASSSCGTNECWDGSKCVSKPTSEACTCTNGTCSVTYKCISGSGWTSTKTCTCDSGFQKNSSGICVHSTCAKGCSVGQYLREITSGYNKGQCECCAPTGTSANGQITQFANCVETAITPGVKKCCRTEAYDGPVPIYYTLPGMFSSCSALGEAIQKPMYETTCPNSMGGLL